MATVATRREKKPLSKKKQQRIDLTPTGLLMEGDYTNFDLGQPRGQSRTVNEGDRDLSTVILGPAG